MASQEDAWDDDYLVQSWDDNVKEYNKYHSIAAKGEDVEEILKAFQAQQAQSNITAADIDHSMAAEDDEDYEPEVPKDADATFAGPTESVLAPNGSQSANGIANRTPQARPGGPSFPQALAGSVQDEGLRNLMMSWYYAGYYTGLHEGQQKAYAEMQPRT